VSSDLSAGTSGPSDERPSAIPDELELRPGQVIGALSFADLFGRSGPVEIEVGVGKGRFVLEQAAARPEVDYLALEWSLKHLRVAKERAGRRKLGNVRFYRADARHVVGHLVPASSISRLHVYCPDPWPKKRHHKRRFFTPSTVKDLERILRPGGYLNLSTDVGEYFREICALLRDHTGLDEAVDPLFPPERGSGNTNYEFKYLAEGRTIHRASWRRAVIS
jgi:tRNA (guanine-N7-)-methyltransferase